MRIELDNEQVKYIRDLISGDMAACKNHIVSAVEGGAAPYGTTGLSGFEYAQSLTSKLRDRLETFRRVNGAILRAEGVIRSTDPAQDT